MPSRLALITLAYAILLGVFGASLTWIAVVGGLAVFWQLVGTVAAGAVPPEPPTLVEQANEALSEDEIRWLNGEDEEG